MAHQEHVLSVFVASPGDVANERNKLEEIIREQNIAWSRELHIRLDLIRWETHSYPGIGADAQDVINDQIPNDYDLFIGIMWSRYGTPTGRAGSGTAEEFLRAKARFDADPESVKIMFYFKDAALPPSKIDTDQLTKVNDFRRSLGTEGLLYQNFVDTEQFGTLVRLHLIRQVQAWQSRTSNSAQRLSGIVRGTQLTVAEPQQIENANDDIGIFDLMEIAEERILELNNISERIAAATVEIGEKMTERSSEMQALPRDSQGNVNRKSARGLIAKSAADMEQFTQRVNAEIPPFRDALNTGINALTKAFTMSIDSDLKEKHEKIQEATEGLIAI